MTSYDDLHAIRDELAALLARADSILAPPPEDLTVLDRTVAIERVLHSEGPLRPVQIARELRAAGRDDPDHFVQVTTQGLWSRGRIARIAPGLYAPLNFAPTLAVS